MPGEFGKRLYYKYGCDGRPMPPTPAWAVVNGEVRRVTIIGLRSASGCGVQADYADTTDKVAVGTFYLFPIARHCKPTLETIRDEWGTGKQWVARVKKNVKRVWEWS
jgi:hypothetical protein